MPSKSFEASSTVSSTVFSKQQPSRGSRSSGKSLLEAPEALGAAMRGPRGSGSGYLEAPEALGAAISRLQRLWEQLSRGSRGSRGPSGFDLSFLEFSRIFSSLETSRGALLTAPGGSRRLSGGSERAQEASGFGASSERLKRLRKSPRPSATQVGPT